jgi:hypothetical protein
MYSRCTHNLQRDRLTSDHGQPISIADEESYSMRCDDADHAFSVFPHTANIRRRPADHTTSTRRHGGCHAPTRVSNAIMAIMAITIATIRHIPIHTDGTGGAGILRSPGMSRPARSSLISPPTITPTARPLTFQPSNGVLRDRLKKSRRSICHFSFGSMIVMSAWLPDESVPNR